MLLACEIGLCGVIAVLVYTIAYNYRHRFIRLLEKEEVRPTVRQCWMKEMTWYVVGAVLLLSVLLTVIFLTTPTELFVLEILFLGSVFFIFLTNVLGKELYPKLYRFSLLFFLLTVLAGFWCTW